MVTVMCLAGSIWLSVIGIGLWRLVLGVRALTTRRAVLRNFRFRVTYLGPVRTETSPTQVAGDWALTYGLLQVIGGLLIAGPLGLVPLLGGGFPDSIFLDPAVGVIIAWLGGWFVKTRANRPD